MIVNPRPGMPVQIWYNKRIAPEMPLHGRVCTVVVVCRPHKTPSVCQVIDGVRKSGPRNHGVKIDGVLWVVPCGNLRPIP